MSRPTEISRRSCSRKNMPHHEIMEEVIMQAKNASLPTPARVEGISSRFHRSRLSWLVIPLLVVAPALHAEAQSVPLTYNAVTDRNFYPDTTPPSIGGA